MTQPLAMDRIHPRRRVLAAVAELIGRPSAPRPRRATTATPPFDPELHIATPFALLSAGPR